jgi:superfamily II DNA/RNA helicase
VVIQESRKLAKTLVNDPIEISVTPRNTTVKSVKQWIHPVDKSKKQALLTHLIQEHVNRNLPHVVIQQYQYHEQRYQWRLKH